jgi:hypothetical protein
MRVLQRAPANARLQRGGVVDSAAGDDYAQEADGLDDFEGVEPFVQGDDDADLAIDAREGHESGFTRFSAPTREYPPCPRVSCAPPGANMYWDLELRSFSKPPLTASNYDYFMHFFDHNFFKNGLLAHTQAASPSLLITENDLWTCPPNGHLMPPLYLDRRFLYAA